MTNTHSYLLNGAVAFAAVLIASSAGRAQTPCLTLQKSGPEIRQFSRNISGRVIPGVSTLTPNAATTVIIMNCQPTTGAAPLRSRQVNYGQLTIDFSVPTGCDQLPLLKGTLVGDYFSLTRLTDPFSTPTAPDQTRIGRHNANGNVMDTSTPPKTIGTFTMRGTIGTNTQRPTSLFGSGPCYWCMHHEGLINIKLYQSPVFLGGGTLTATYCWDVNVDTPDCKSDPCLMQQYFQQGTMDGIVEAGCGTIKMPS